MRVMYNGMPLNENIHGEPVKRSMREYPYSYDEHVIYKNGYREGDRQEWSDQLLHQNREKFNKAGMQVWNATPQMFPDKSPQELERFLQIYHDDDSIKLTGMEVACNAENGYPYWIFYFRSAKMKKLDDWLRLEHEIWLKAKAYEKANDYEYAAIYYGLYKAFDGKSTAMCDTVKKSPLFATTYAYMKVEKFACEFRHEHGVNYRPSVQELNDLFVKQVFPMLRLVFKWTVGDIADFSLKKKGLNVDGMFIAMKANAFLKVKRPELCENCGGYEWNCIFKYMSNTDVSSIENCVMDFCFRFLRNFYEYSKSANMSYLTHGLLDKNGKVKLICEPYLTETWRVDLKG